MRVVAILGNSSVVFMALVVGFLVGVGCTKYVELHNAGDRVWLISSDGREVWRCQDHTPAGPYLGGLKVFCKQATLYDDRSDPMIDQAPSSISTTKGAGQ
jgi:hypothetical protein